MTLHVYTARLGYRGDDALDITRANAGKAHRAGRPFAGFFLAPSWDILGPALTAREEADDLIAQASVLAASVGCAGSLFRVGDEDARRAAELRERAERIEAEMWDRYVPAFTEEMRTSYRQNRASWDALLTRNKVVLLCFCANHLHCHRRILAGTILPALGAIDCGEIETRKGKAA
jgi:hypothetical protein